MAAEAARDDESDDYAGSEDEGLQLPSEIVNRICHHLDGLLREPPCPDTWLQLAQQPARYSTRRSATTEGPLFEASPHDVLHQNFANLCLVNSTWRAAARPWLWRDVRVNVPRFWIKLVTAITGSLDGEAEETFGDRIGRPSFSRAGRPSISQVITPPGSRGTSPNRAELAVHGRRLDVMLASTSINERSASTGSVQSVQSMSSMGEDVLHDASDVGLLVKTLSFSRFRSLGMRRTGREGSAQRFVTSERLLALLQGTRAEGALDDPDEEAPDPTLRGRLEAVGLTEYCDSSINVDVLNELLLRGGVLGSSWPLAQATAPIVALDLCACVSARFASALSQLLDSHGWSEYADEDKPRTIFPHLRRLGLHSVLIRGQLLVSLVSACPGLTHLDLTNTRSGPAMCRAIASTQTRLEALSLASCKALTSECLRELLVDGGNATAHLIDLSLFGDANTPSPVEVDDLMSIILYASCLQSGKMQALDLGSAQLTDDLLAIMPPQPHLIDFGISSCPALSYAAVGHFLVSKAPRVELLDVSGSCLPFESRSTHFAKQLLLDLHQFIQDVASPTPAPLSAWSATGGMPEPDMSGRKTNLRVIELDERALETVAGGADAWKVIFGRGRRGWYCDTRVGPVDPRAPITERSLRALPPGDPQRAVLEMLVKLNGNVQSEVGWRPRKLEVLHGLGRWGRAFARIDLR